MVWRLDKTLLCDAVVIKRAMDPRVWHDGKSQWLETNYDIFQMTLKIFSFGGVLSRVFNLDAAFAITLGTSEHSDSNRILELTDNTSWFYPACLLIF